MAAAAPFQEFGCRAEPSREALPGARAEALPPCLEGLVPEVASARKFSSVSLTDANKSPDRATDFQG